MTTDDIYINKATGKEFRFTKPERSHLGYLEPIDFNLGAKAVSDNSRTRTNTAYDREIAKEMREG